MRAATNTEATPPRTSAAIRFVRFNLLHRDCRLDGGVESTAVSWWSPAVVVGSAAVPGSCDVMASRCHPATERTLRATLSDLRTRVLETLPLFAPVKPLGGGRVPIRHSVSAAAEANTRTPLDVQTKLVRKTCGGKAGRR
jgi:hypothetical protein